jgi:hypothetical protein
LFPREARQQIFRPRQSGEAAKAGAVTLATALLAELKFRPTTSPRRGSG